MKILEAGTFVLFVLLGLYTSLILVRAQHLKSLLPLDLAGDH
jgi:hypothetical protein